MLLPDELHRDQYHLLVESRLEGVPVAYITGRLSFMGVDMLAGPEAVLPRRETEVLGRAALRALRRLVRARGFARVLDLCTGCGNLALALAHYEPNCWVSGVDISAPAVRLARRNAGYLGLNDRVQFLQGDLFSPFEAREFWGQIDMVVCNPPYVSSHRIETMPFETAGFEPRGAFDGGPFGMDVQERLVREAPRFLKPDSSLFVEVGLGQGEILACSARKSGAYREIQYVRDEKEDIRAVVMQV